MGLIFFAFCVVSILGFFFYRRLRRTPPPENIKVAGRYATLISGLADGKPHYQKSGIRMVKFDLKKGRDQYVYAITETEGKIIVVWTIESQAYGRRGKEWSFDSSADQACMLNTIQSDLKSYLRSIHTT